MCNLYANMSTVDEMRRLFGVDPSRVRLGNAEPQPAIFPKGDAAVVRLDETGDRILENTHWGFVLPRTSKKTGKPIQPKAVNNARDDKLRSSGFWKSSFQKRRCLVPATSFCEPKGRNPATYVWFGIKGEEDRPPFAFAGIWTFWKGTYKDEERSLITSSIVTSTPNELVRETHPDRMPVILEPTDYGTWLTGSADDAFDLIKPFPAEHMEIFKKGEGLTADPG